MEFVTISSDDVVDYTDFFETCQGFVRNIRLCLNERSLKLRQYLSQSTRILNHQTRDCTWEWLLQREMLFQSCVPLKAWNAASR